MPCWNNGSNTFSRHCPSVMKITCNLDYHPPCIQYLGASAQESESTSRKGWRGGVGSAAKNEKCVESPWAKRRGERGAGRRGGAKEERHTRSNTPQRCRTSRKVRGGNRIGRFYLVCVSGRGTAHPVQYATGVSGLAKCPRGKPDRAISSSMSFGPSCRGYVMLR